MLAVDNQSGRRFAFEAQLAGMPIYEGKQRIARYAQDGIQSLWLTTSSASWPPAIPGCRLTIGSEFAMAEPDEVEVISGVFVFRGEAWVPRTDMSLSELIREVLGAELETQDHASFRLPSMAPSDTAIARHHHSLCLTWNPGGESARSSERTIGALSASAGDLDTANGEVPLE